MSSLEYTFTDGTSLAVGTMFCIGRNYANHARELGNEVPESPIVFLKPPTAYVANDGVVEIPSISNNMHHEVELVVVIGKDCRNVTIDEVESCIAGYAVGIDFTLRDVQNSAKQKGEPWATAKGFYASAPISAVVPASTYTGIPDFDLQLEVNGVVKQQGSTTHMERSVEELVVYLSSIFGLQKGDCIFTGTPEGVGKVERGDMVSCTLRNVVELSVNIR
ncbi:MAG: fumarylacetoacetate hydrolase family protein [Candidatus Kapaibacterium sp.]